MRSFGLIELLIVIAILAIISALVGINFHLFQRQVNLDATINQIIATLRSAQSQTLASQNQSSYGVYFETNAYTLFKGPDYILAAPDNKVYAIPQDLELSVISIAGGNGVLFQRITGQTDNTGTLTLRVETNPLETRTIIIEHSGNVSIDQGVSPTDTRITDSRHLHFDFSENWSIQGASTLTLVFYDPPNPSQTQNISMAGYFNGSGTEFDWEGTVNAGGENQTLHIHTHLLTATNTILCVHRDRRFNTKALDISIDTKAIVSYDPSGTPTVGAFGGTMEAQ